MFRRRIRSAIFIDHENIAVSSRNLANFIAWLEHGKFDAQARERRFLIKRVYWNATAEPHRAAYEAAGFDVARIKKYPGLRNAADIRMAIDVIETALKQTRIEEFILVTRDSDFVPVLQRLEQMKKKSVILVDDQNEGHVKAFEQHANAIIPMPRLKEAFAFEAPPQRPWYWFRAARKVASTREPLDVAAERIVSTLSLRPNAIFGYHAIRRVLRSVPGYTGMGDQRYLGTGSYKALMTELSQRDKRIKIVPQTFGGFAVRYTSNEPHKTEP
jgi:hypothetical protein